GSTALRQHPRERLPGRDTRGGTAMAIFDFLTDPLAADNKALTQDVKALVHGLQKAKPAALLIAEAQAASPTSRRSPLMRRRSWTSANVVLARLRAHARRRIAEAAAEGSVEIGEIAKPGIQRQRADAAVGQARIGQHSVGAAEPLSEQELRERGV